MSWGGSPPPRILIGCRQDLGRQLPKFVEFFLLVFRQGEEQLLQESHRSSSCAKAQMSSFRASATIIVLRVPLRPSAALVRNH